MKKKKKVSDRKKVDNSRTGNRPRLIISKASVELIRLENITKTFLVMQSRK